ncbi:MAG TPA: phosphotransferase [Anditalea sp.]|nr:phosphotransferase [Anditalea sp.]
MAKVLSLIKLLFGLTISVREFKDLIVPIAARKYQLLFEIILKKYDPSLNLNYTKLFKIKKFINEGRGAGILKPNRKLSSPTSDIFEKIFYNDSPGLNPNIRFNKNISPHLINLNIRTPKIIEIVCGEKLTVFLFEFLKLNRIPAGEEYRTLKETTINMFYPPDSALKSDKIQYDRFIIGNERLIKAEYFSELELFKLNAVVKSTPVYFQHFDLKEDNVFMGNIIIDWDNSGNYHLGADFGVLLLSYFVFNERDFFNCYKDEIRDYFNRVDLNIPFDIFYLSVLFHFLNLYHGYSSEEEHLQKIHPVIRDCKLKLKEVTL